MTMCPLLYEASPKIVIWKGEFLQKQFGENIQGNTNQTTITMESYYEKLCHDHH